jgi:hypothetical protein
MRKVMERITARRLFALLALILWGLMLHSGIKICLGAAEQGIKGLPSDGQLRLYVWLPLSIVLIELILIFAARKINAWIAVALQVISFFLILPVGMLFGGGV